MFMCVFMCVCYIYTPRGVYMTTTPPPLSSILYPLSSPRLADARTHPSIHPSSPLRAVNQHSDGWHKCPTDHLFTSTVHTHAYTYIHRRATRANTTAGTRVCDGRATEGSVAPPGPEGVARASIASHRHTDARRRRRRDVFHHGSRDVPPHDDDDDDDALDDDATGDDRARRRCESR